MEEKKLTDEEVVKALECCTSEDVFRCRNCPFIEPCYQDGYEDEIKIVSLNLIHRLQDEKSCLANKVSLYQKMLDEEFEPLKETIDKQKAEIEQLKDENRQNLFNSNTRICELDNEKAALQKQIDELKEDIAEKDGVIDNLIKERPSIEKYAIKYTAKEVLQDIYNKSTCISYYGKQYRAIETVRFDGIVKSNGVEVE